MKIQKEPNEYKYKCENYYSPSFNWNDQSVKWYLDSEKDTEFYKKTEEELYPFIKDCRTLLDIGCGIGSFAVEFAKRGIYVTAINKSPLDFWKKA